MALRHLALDSGPRQGSAGTKARPSIEREPFLQLAESSPFLAALRQMLACFLYALRDLFL